MSASYYTYLYKNLPNQQISSIPTKSLQLEQIKSRLLNCCTTKLVELQPQVDNILPVEVTTG